MDDSESVRATKGETLVAGGGGGGSGSERKIGQADDKVVRKYARGELFEIAQSIEECRPISEDLDQFKRADWTQYHLDVIDWDERGADQHQQLLRPAPIKMGRTNGALDSEFGVGRLGADNWGNHHSQQQQHRRIYRMTSSPAMKSSWGPSGGGLAPRQLDDLSSQVRAKYARLIKTMTSSANSSNIGPTGRASNPSQLLPAASMAPSSLQASRQSLVRTTSHNSRLTRELSHTRRPVEAAHHQAGPAKHQHRGERRNSEEPMSLPYSINTSGRPSPRDLSVLSSKTWMRSLDKSKSIDDQSSVGNEAGLEDQDDSPDQDQDTPIMRFAAPSKLHHGESVEDDEDRSPSRQAAAMHADVDEDDFDITSLLSITVLSDIKTIRQDLASLGRQSSNLSKSSLSRAKSHELPSRMPARSRTALELHYNNSNRGGDPEQRRLPNTYDHQQQQQQQLKHRHQQLYAGQAAIGRSHYQSRQAAQLNFSDTSSDHDYNQSESLPFDWQANSASHSYSAGVGLFASSEVAARSQQHLASTGARQEPLVSAPGKAPPSDSKKPVDESSAKIIKLFKEQVKARAEAPIEQKDEEAAEKPQAVGAASKSRSAGDGSGSKPTGRGATEINSIELNETRSAAGEEQASSEPADGKQSSGAPSGRPDKPASGTNPAESESGTATVATTNTAMVTKAAAPSQPTTGKLDNEQPPASACEKEQQQRADGKSGGTARVSNIPRLISLYRAKSNQDAATATVGAASNQAEKRSAQVSASPTTDGGADGSQAKAAGVGGGRANIKQSCKFVSQYKALRGKSLADEVEESSAPS